MIVEHERLNYDAPWSFPDILMFTGNPVIARHGGIVMGRGAAKQCRDLFPGVDRAFADKIRQDPDSPIHFVQLAPGKFLGWFQVKDHWQNDADPAIIERAAIRLRTIMDDEFKQTGRRITIHCNFPGVGNGHLQESDVLPILQRHLSDWVVFYR